MSPIFNNLQLMANLLLSLEANPDTLSLYLYIYQNASVQNKDSVKKTYPCYIVTFQTNNNNYIISLNIQSVTLMLEVAVHYDRSQVDVEIKVDRGWFPRPEDKQQR